MSMIPTDLQLLRNKSKKKLHILLLLAALIDPRIPRSSFLHPLLARERVKSPFVKTNRQERDKKKMMITTLFWVPSFTMIKSWKRSPWETPLRMSRSTISISSNRFMSRACSCIRRLPRSKHRTSSWKALLRSSWSPWKLRMKRSEAAQSIVWSC